jgi:hypothetical protein
MSDVASSPSSSSAIHIVAHLFNLERYHLSQSEGAGGLLAALSKLGNTPNESYLNPVRTFHTVSSRMLTHFLSEKKSLLSYPFLGNNMFPKLLIKELERIFCQMLNIISPFSKIYFFDN